MAYAALIPAVITAATTAYSVLSRPDIPPAPKLPPPVPQPPPIDQTQLQEQQSLASQIARRGRASTVLTNQPDQSKLGS